jgi:pimeloyl-ACP methyl ester carboxylesterase
MSTATVNGVDLAYVEQGQGEPVLFVHGGVGDYRAWDQQMDAFGAGYRAIALSCRGYWPNPKLRPDESITLDTFVDDLAEFVQALHAGPVHLVGHSSPGGFGSLRLASRHPELLRTLVLLEPPAFPLLGVSIPPRPAQVIKLLIRHPRVGIGFIKFGAKGMGPALKAFERGDDAGALRVFMAANASDAVVETFPRLCSSDSSTMSARSRLRSRPGFPRSVLLMPGPSAFRRCWSRARSHRRTLGP